MQGWWWCCCAEHFAWAAWTSPFLAWLVKRTQHWLRFANVYVDSIGSGTRVVVAVAVAEEVVVVVVVVLEEVVAVVVVLVVLVAVVVRELR